MSNEIDPRTTNSPDNVQENTTQAQAHNELSDEELSTVSGGGIRVPGVTSTTTPPDNIIAVL